MQLLYHGRSAAARSLAFSNKRNPARSKHAYETLASPALHPSACQSNLLDAMCHIRGSVLLLRIALIRAKSLNQ